MGKELIHELLSNSQYIYLDNCSRTSKGHVFYGGFLFLFNQSSHTYKVVTSVTVICAGNWEVEFIYVYIIIIYRLISRTFVMQAGVRAK